MKFNSSGSVPEHKYFIGIDQSVTHTGITVLEKEEDNTYSIIESFGICTYPENPFEERLSLIVDTVSRTIDKYNFGNRLAIAIEGLAYSPGNTNNRALLFGLFSVLLVSFYNKNLIYSIIPPTTLKKLSTGSGKAKKQEMLAAIPENEVTKLEFLSNLKSKSKKFEDIVDSYFLAKAKLLESIITKA